MSLAYIATYTKKNSVEHDPERDFDIGVANKVVGCGQRLKARGFHWFTLINDKLVYNGPLGDEIAENPWAASGRHWYTYKVQHHLVLGNTDAVLAAAGIDRSVLPKSQNRWVKNPLIQKLIDYALAQVHEKIDSPEA